MTSKNISIAITGDFCPTGRVEEYCLNNNYKNIYGDVLSILHSSDLAITNLECPLTEKVAPISKLGPNLRAHPKCVDLLKLGKFGVVTLANNHIMDQGLSGLDSTIKTCTEANIKTVGVGLNVEKAMEPLYVTVNEELIAFINCAENEFSIATDEQPGANHLDPIRIYDSIKQAKEKTKTILVILHGGNEFCDIPSPRMIDTYRFIAGLGVTAVIGHHTHCSSGLEWINGIPIIYSLGNFLFDHINPVSKDWNIGLLANIRISNGVVTKLELYPFKQGGEKFSINLIRGIEKDKYFAYIDELSGVIADKSRHKQAWLKFLAKKEMEYLPPLLTMGRLERYLYKRGLYFGQRANKRRLLYLLNLIRCEAHRDVSTALLQQLINKGV